MNIDSRKMEERIEIIKVSKLASFHRGTLITRKMVGKKFFLQIQSINIMCPNKENMIVMPITKRMEIIMNTYVCLIS